MIEEIKERLAKLPKGELRYNLEREAEYRSVCLIEEGDVEEKCICCVALSGCFDDDKNDWDEPTISQWDAFGSFFAHAPADIKYLLKRIEELEKQVNP